MTRKWINSGIQKKYLKYMVALLMLALFLSSIGVWAYVHKNMTAVIVDKYEFMNEKMGISMDNLYKKTDEVTAECIIDDDVQKSLKTKGLEEVEKSALSKYFAYIDLDHVSEYCYVDNKKMYIQNPIRRFLTKILKRADLLKSWEMSMRRRSGSGRRMSCLEMVRKLCLLEDM